MKKFNNPEVSILKVNTCDVIATSEAIQIGTGVQPPKADAPMRELFEDEEY